MNDIFISALSQPITSWQEAFPEACYVQHDAMPHEIYQDKENIFWIHQNTRPATGLQLEAFPHTWLVDTVKKIQSNTTAAAKIIVLTNHPNQTDAVLCLRIGAMGYVHAYADTSVLKEVKSVVQNGGLWIGQDFLKLLIENATKRLGSQKPYANHLMEKLTIREQEVAQQVAKGLSNKEIARVLKITERTVKAHMAHIFERLGAKDRLQLALMVNHQRE